VIARRPVMQVPMKICSRREVLVDVCYCDLKMLHRLDLVRFEYPRWSFGGWLVGLRYIRKTPPKQGVCIWGSLHSSP
jgi:hypothetical protein